MKIKITDRIKNIADLVPKTEVLADIGCDHAYISIYLMKTGKVGRVIASDLREGPLRRAEENIFLEGFEHRFFLRLCNGLSDYEDGEADTVLISGMGGFLISDILKNGAHALKSVKTLVLEPQSDAHLVRERLRELSFRITDERIAREEGKFYQVIRAERCDGGEIAETSPIFDKFGKILLENGDEGLYEFLTDRKEGYERILSNFALQASPKEASEERMEVIRREAKEVNEALSWFRRRDLFKSETEV